MTAQEQVQIKTLIPDLRPSDHTTLNTKRINFIYGQGAIVYNDTYAVEIYIPKNNKEEITFFAVDRHFGKVDKIGEYYRKLPVYQYESLRVTPLMKAQFDEDRMGTNNVREMYNRGLKRQVA